MDKPTRNLIQKATQDARRLLESEFSEQLEGIFDILPNGRIEPEPGGHLNPQERIVREKIVAAIEHEKAGGVSAAEAVASYLREASYTCLNRFAALKMMEGQGLVQECVSNGEQSSGFKEFCGLAPGLAELPDKGYRLYIESLFDELSTEIRVLFDRQDMASLLWPRRKAFEGLLDILNREELAGIWGEDETIGWVYQYFNPPEERKAMREASQAPRNSRELAVRNQFFTPRYVVEFLTDNTLGQIWYEMTQGETGLKDFCRYLVRRPVEIFLKPGEAAPVQTASDENLSQEELLKQPVHILYRPLKDPRTIRMLDPACGSMHFGLYSFDLFERIYEEAWELELRLGPAAFVREAGLKPLTETYPDKKAFVRDLPRLIIEHNIHGIDIDPRAVQIAGLSLWLRAQRCWHNQGVKPAVRPRINRSNIVCAEPMPGEEDMRREFTASLKPRVLGQIVDEVFDKMKLAGEAGSLLKIEEEIKEAVAAAKTQWEEQPKPVQMELFGGTIPVKPVQMELRFDVKGITDERFWEQAEGRILDALKDYAEQAENGRSIRRRLFADDAARGFAFIDLCRKLYDVVLMNPPFGEATAACQRLLVGFPKGTPPNLYSLFMVQAARFTCQDGTFGMISDSTFLKQPTFLPIRRFLLSKEAPLYALIDLGWDVLDANVRTALTVVHKMNADRLYGLDIADEENRGLLLLQAISDHALSIKSHKEILALPKSVFALSLSITAGRELIGMRSLGNLCSLPWGCGANDSFLLFRLRWEVSERDVGKQWALLTNGGTFSPFYRENFFVCRREMENGESAFTMEFRKGNDKLYDAAGQELYYLPGLTYPKRSEFFHVSVLPAGHIFTPEGKGLFLNDFKAVWCQLGILNSAFVASVAGIICGPHKQRGDVELIKVPTIPVGTANAISQEAQAIFNLGRNLMQSDENSTWFLFPGAPNQRPEGITSLKDFVKDRHLVLLRASDSFVAALRAIDSHIWSVIPSDLRGFCKNPGLEDQRARLWRDLSLDVTSIMSFAIGTVLGRWDTRIAKDPSLAAKLPDPFDPLPICPPGMLVGPDGLPAQPNRIVSEEWLRARPDANTLPPAGIVQNPTISDSEYPIRISWDGILVDDPGFDGGQYHKEDIVRRTREVLSVLWKDKAQDIEQEACEILGVSDLRTYFRKGFFPDHIKRYSKSRRKAPIYWQLSTASGSYSVWLYYHRFTKDTFYKLLNEYVNPKLQFEERELLSARQQYGQSPTASQRKEIAARETFVAELKAFKDEVARIAPLWDPDLNDGVIINFAPLWRLVPQNRSWQKECKTIWDKLLNGDYDWAHLAMHLWPERVVPKCTTDRSLAIAHGLDEALWEEDDKGKWHAKEISKETLNALIEERTSATVKAALEELLNASVANGAGRRKTKRKS